MRIGIIGAGNIGRAVASLGISRGHAVMISNSRAPETLASTIQAIGCQAGTPEQAAAFGAVVVIAIPLKNYQSIPADPLAGKIVIDANNYYPDRDGHIAALDRQETTTSELLAKHLPTSRIVKTFNAIMAKDIEADGRTSGSPGRRALPLAGDDATAKRVVTDLLYQFGFDAVDAGHLSEGWRFERARPAYCVPLNSVTLSKTLTATKRDNFVAEASWRH